MTRTLLTSATILALSLAACSPSDIERVPGTVDMSIEELRDKIKGGWAAQVIGVTYGGPTEFQYNGTFMQDDDPIAWYDGYLTETFHRNPGLYDDIYMDLTFVDVLEREGLDAPATSFARAFAEAPYPLWHANQMARYNILSGIEPPSSGHWRNNPHADDIDFQIEADFAGLMNPAMPNSAAGFCDTIGHTMNYGDGWYGGVFVAALYAEAFTTSDVNTVVQRALSMIPKESLFYQTIADVILWHARYPHDWRQTWFEIQKKWSREVGCPEGVFRAFNIDARINAAYVVLGLLYGGGDFDLTLSIATRAGQDSDCNPATAAGILGTMLGYDDIPNKWKSDLPNVESIDFPYTSISLSDVYDLSLEHALSLIERNGGLVTTDSVRIVRQTPEPVPLEQSFVGHYPFDQKWGINQWAPLTVKTEAVYEFDGVGFVVDGRAVTRDGNEHIVVVDLYVDDVLEQTVELTTDFRRRKNTPFWQYDMAEGSHTLRFVVRIPNDAANFEINRVIFYRSQPAPAATH